MAQSIRGHRLTHEPRCGLHSLLCTYSGGVGGSVWCMNTVVIQLVRDKCESHHVGSGWEVGPLRHARFGFVHIFDMSSWDTQSACRLSSRCSAARISVSRLGLAALYRPACPARWLLSCFRSSSPVSRPRPHGLDRRRATKRAFTSVLRLGQKSNASSPHCIETLLGTHTYLCTHVSLCSGREGVRSGVLRVSAFQSFF